MCPFLLSVWLQCSCIYLFYVLVQSKKFQVDISAEEVYAEVLPNHKKDQIAALQENGTKVSVGKHVMEPCRVSRR